jgi:3D (Asp-Asp-Asp) domain-containing protein
MTFLPVLPEVFVSPMKLLSLRQIAKALRSAPVETAAFTALLVLFGFAAIPASAGTTIAATLSGNKATALEVAAMQNQSLPYGTFPEADLRGPSYTVTVQATAYNSVPWQTDDTPFTTASNTQTRFGVIAANFLPFGTRVRIPEVFGDQIFIVEDRMNPRYTKRIDIWMEEIPDAREFGLKTVTIEVYPVQK